MTKQGLKILKGLKRRKWKGRQYNVQKTNVFINMRGFVSGDICVLLSQHNALQF